MGFWNSPKPTVALVSSHLTELRKATLQLDEALQKAPTMNYIDAMWIAQRAYKVGSYLKSCSRDTRDIPPPILPEEAQGILDQIRELVPLVLEALDKANTARVQFDRLYVVQVVKIQLRWLANAETEFANAVLDRAPTEEMITEGQQIVKELDDAFELCLNVYGTARGKENVEAIEVPEGKLADRVKEKTEEPAAAAPASETAPAATATA